MIDPGNGLFLVAPKSSEDADLLLVRLGEDGTSILDDVVYRYRIDPIEGQGSVYKGKFIVGDGLLDYAPSYNCREVLGITTAGLYVWNVTSQKQIASVGFEELDGTGIARMTVSSTDTRAAILTRNSNLYVYDYLTDNVVQVDTGGYAVTTAQFSEDGSRILCCDITHDALLLFDEEYKLKQAIPMDFDIVEGGFASYDDRGNSRDDRFLLASGAKTRILKFDESASRAMITRVEGVVEGSGNAVLSPDGKEIWYFTGLNDSYSSYALNVLFPETGENRVLETFSEWKNCRGLYTAGDQYMVREKTDEKDRRHITVYDTATLEIVKEAASNAELYAFLSGAEGSGEEALDPKEFLFLDDIAYMNNGAIYRKSDGEKLIDLHDEDLRASCGCRNGSGLLLYRDALAEPGDLYYLRFLDGAGLRDLAEETLGGRVLTEEEKKTYFLE